jgi:hypothetical protein
LLVNAASNRTGWCFAGDVTFYRIRNHLKGLLPFQVFTLPPFPDQHFFYLLASGGPMGDNGEGIFFVLELLFVVFFPLVV